MNWLQKLSSVTFDLKGAFDSNRKTVYRLSDELNIWAHDHVPRTYFQEDFQEIDIDGIDVRKITGTINWYVRNEELAKDIPMYVQQWIQEEMSPLGIEVRLGKLERSNLHPEFLVYRIHVVNNPTATIPDSPDLNVANDNAVMLLGLLNLPLTYQGLISIDDMEHRLSLVTEPRIQEFTEETVNYPATESTPDITIHGRDLEQMKRYLDGLRRLIAYGRQYGFDTIVWH